MVALQHIDNLSRKYPASHPVATGIGTSQTVLHILLSLHTSQKSILENLLLFANGDIAKSYKINFYSQNLEKVEQPHLRKSLICLRLNNEESYLNMMDISFAVCTSAPLIHLLDFILVLNVTFPSSECIGHLLKYY